MAQKLKILFLCTGNSCRSQMAEGWTRALKGDLVKAYSAGIEIHGLNQVAVEVMADVGVDISKHTSKHIDTLSDRAEFQRLGKRQDCIDDRCTIGCFQVSNKTLVDLQGVNWEALEITE